MDDATFGAFVAWMRREGITWDDADLKLLPRGAVAGGGVRAARALRSGAVVATIPKSATLTVRTTAIAELLRERGVRCVASACVQPPRNVLTCTLRGSTRASWAPRVVWALRWR